MKKLMAFLLVALLILSLASAESKDSLFLDDTLFLTDPNISSSDTYSLQIHLFSADIDLDYYFITPEAEIDHSSGGISILDEVFSSFEELGLEETAVDIEVSIMYGKTENGVTTYSEWSENSNTVTFMMGEDTPIDEEEMVEEEETLDAAEEEPEEEVEKPTELE